MCALTVDDHTSKSGVLRYMLGGEPIVRRADGAPLVDGNGRRSYVTSAGAGPSLGKHILMSYLPPQEATVGNELAVEYLGERYPVTVQTNDAAGVFDPDNTRVRS
jgi:glycine cleavage system aminomethyltransferase T